MILQVRIELNYWTIKDITVDYCRSHPPVITGKWKSQWLSVIYICVHLFTWIICPFIFIYLFIFIFIYLFICPPIYLFLVVILPFKPPKIGCDYRIVLISIYIPKIVGSMPIVSPYARFPPILFLLRIPTPLNPCLIWMLDGNIKNSTTYTIFYPDSWIISHYSPLLTFINHI